jgi:DNA-binding IclR family transcriptional regulator
MDDSKSSIQSVERAIAILKCFSIEHPERGVSELSRKLGLHKSTVSRLASSLADGGLLSRNPVTGRYRLGVEVLALASRVTLQANIRGVARPVLRDLAYEVQETVSLSVHDSGAVVDVEQFEPPNYQIKNVGQVGRRMDLHATAAGKVFLAYMPKDRLPHYINQDFEQYTPKTVIDSKKLVQILGEVRERGYAVAEEEWEVGLNLVAAPIFDMACQVIAAASISGPVYRVTRDLFPSLAAHLKRAAAEISERMGYGMVIC